MANNAQEPGPQPQPRPQQARREVPLPFPNSSALFINPDYVPILSRKHVIRVLPDADEDPEERQFRFLSFLTSDQPDPDPVKEKAKQDAILKEHVERIKNIKARLSRVQESRDRGDVEYISPVQRIYVSCYCEIDEYCPHDDMRAIKYELFDGEDDADDNGGNDGGDDPDDDDEPANKKNFNLVGQWVILGRGGSESSWSIRLVQKD